MSPSVDRRGLALAVGLAAAGGALLLVATGRSWAEVVVRQPPLPARTVSVSGSALAPVAPALGLVALAGAAALVAVHGWVRRLLGALLLVVGVGALLTLGRNPVDAAAVQVLLTTAGSASVTHGNAARVAYALGALLVIAAGALALARGGRWPGLGARYEAPAARRPTPTDPWIALDRGEDPTLR